METIRVPLTELEIRYLIALLRVDYDRERIRRKRTGAYSALPIDLYERLDRIAFGPTENPAAAPKPAPSGREPKRTGPR